MTVEKSATLDAAMRQCLQEELESLRQIFADAAKQNCIPLNATELANRMQALETALASDAGKRLLARLEAAERVCAEAEAFKMEGGARALVDALAAWEVTK